ncbi:MAG: DUF1573 domain-containing protein [Phycisphaerales bacterium]|nr:DUF1573 domain-containing protein [Phycisphaerales bacterium]
MKNTMPRCASPARLLLACGLVLGLGSYASAQVDDHAGHAHDAAPAAQPAGAPAVEGPLKFQELEHDFGRIMDTAAVQHTFKFTNTGASSITFTEKKPQTSCGCTAGDFAKPSYAPGESGEVTVTFNPAGKAGHKNTQRITIRYKDDSRPDTMMPEVTLTINADVKTSVAINPPQMVNFGDVVQGDLGKQTITVTGRGDDFKVTYASVARSRLFDVKLLGTKEVEVDGEKLRQSTLELSLLGTPRKGQMQSLVTFRTTDPNIPLTSVNVQANIVGDLNLLPPRLSAGAVEVGTPFERMIRVVSRKNKPFKIEKIDQTSNLPTPLTTEITPLNEGEGVGYQIVVKGTAPEQVGPLNATLTAVTDVPGEEKLDIQVVGSVRPVQQVILPPLGPMGPSLTPPEKRIVTPSKTATPPPAVRPAGGH